MKTFNFAQKNLWLPSVFGVILVGIVQSAHPEDIGSEGARGAGSAGTGGTM